MFISRSRYEKDIKDAKYVGWEEGNDLRDKLRSEIEALRKDNMELRAVLERSNDDKTKDNI